IGLTDEAPPRDVESLARLAVILDQVPAIFWTTDGELRVISRAGAGLKSQQMLPERIVGASLLELQSQHKVGSESVAAHRRALAGESVSYQILLPPRCYDAHVEPLRDEGGALVGVVGLAVDVSDREQALAQAARRSATSRSGCATATARSAMASLARTRCSKVSNSFMPGVSRGTSRTASRPSRRWRSSRRWWSRPTTPSSARHWRV